MFEMTIRQRLAALVLLFFLVLGGFLLYLRGNQDVAGEFPLPRNEERIYVHVCGAVRKAGVFRFKPGLRKFQVLQKTGGTLPEADLNQVNLAEFVEDGEQIYVPRQGEVVRAASRKKSGRKGPANSGTGSKRAKVEAKVSFPCDINRATAAQLEAVPGIGPALAARIIQYRTANGPFLTYDDLDNVSGIGAKKLKDFRAYLQVQ